MKECESRKHCSYTNVIVNFSNAKVAEANAVQLSICFELSCFHSLQAPTKDHKYFRRRWSWSAFHFSHSLTLNGRMYHLLHISVTGLQYSNGLETPFVWGWLEALPLSFWVPQHVELHAKCEKFTSTSTPYNLRLPLRRRLLTVKKSTTKV